MIAVDEDNDLLPPGIGTRELDSTVISIRAAVSEGDFGLHTARVNRDQAFGIFHRTLIVGVGNCILGKPVQLFPDSFCDNRICTAHIQGGSTGEKIDIFLSVHILQDSAFGTFDYQRIIGKPLARSNNRFITRNNCHAFCILHLYDLHISVTLFKSVTLWCFRNDQEK